MSPGHVHPSPASPGFPAESSGGRLNLLLSWGGWRPDSWADRMAALLEPMGVTSLKARTARQAEQVIRTQPVHVAVVDLGLPLDFGTPSDEGGPRILELLRRMDEPPPVVIVRSPRAIRDMHRDMCAALRCDAFAVVDRRSADVEMMLKVLQRCMERFYQGRWPSAHGDPSAPHRRRPLS
ncbi:MAG TPA: hypothetical protein PKE29_17510 [Phycisphaerales bacterium]|nr:hypothetical protein [Phycisphaerales bacterium]